MCVSVNFSCPILFFGRDIIAALYTNDIEVQKIATHLIIFAAIFQIADVIQVTDQCIARIKDTKIPTLIMMPDIHRLD